MFVETEAPVALLDEPLETLTTPDQSEPLPRVFAQRPFCRYQPIEKRVAEARVLIINDLLRDERDLSEYGRMMWWGEQAEKNLYRERQISAMAVENIEKNVLRLVRKPTTRIAHVSEIAEAAREFQPDAVVLSGTLTDFDFYKRAILENFKRFIHATQIPVLAICGGHQLVGYSFGAPLATLDNFEPRAKQTNRLCEYQYRFVRIIKPDDPIFNGINDRESGIWQDYTKEARILRVWQNHGLQVVGVPEGFRLLATSYLCKNQMMVKRSEGQLIYCVQFHIEKSFEDWAKNPTRWEHPNESRDGRVIFENFLFEALKHNASMADGELRMAD
jgi:GMP synthase (glutamine-hydrolysing)